MIIKQKIKVEFSYKIHFIRDLFNPSNNLLENTLKNTKPKVIVFLDSKVAHLFPGLKYKIKRWFNFHPKNGTLVSIIVIQGGEQSKNNPKYYKNIANALYLNELDRHSYVITIGGGAVLDTVGFIASITHRGIRHIRVPTTVLSQCDSGVGVKNAINYYGTKNYFGTFTPPYAVINDFEFLKTLDTRDWLGGIAEAFKVAIIKNGSFLRYLVTNAGKLKKRNEKVMEFMIFNCARLHANHIVKGKDPFEINSSRPLDFGHWSAHYLEVLTDYKLRHGEAVAIGIVLDMIIAKNRGLVSKKESQFVIRGLKNCGFKLWHPVLETREKNNSLGIYRGLELFRQHLGGKLTLIMPAHLGKMRQINNVLHNEVEKAVQEMKNEIR